jgi:ABC-type Fe3+/spermidine/putrescine transport system ATPase subunit
MTREEITRRFDDIVDFAEIGGFIDAPVTTYSSGMYVRLGFAIAIHCNPDIIIADEILSVGDYMFQMKCFKRLLEILETGCTVILVSHSEIAMRSVCKKGAIMDAGKLIDVGKIDDMILKYRSLLINRKFGKEQSSIFSPKVGVSTTGGARIYNIEVRDKNGDLIRQNNRELKKLNYSKNSQLSVVFDVEILQEIHNPRVGLYIRDMTKAELTYVCAAVVSKDNFNGRLTLLRGKRRFGFEIDISNLTPNVYTIMTGIADEQYHIKVYDCLDETDRITFEILNSDELVECDALLNRPYYLPKYKFNMEELG